MTFKKFLILVAILLISSVFFKLNIYSSGHIRREPASPTIPERPKIESRGDQETFRYEQKKIQRITEKNLKIKVAVSRFDEGLTIEGSLFNPEKVDEEFEKRLIEIQDSKVIIKIDEEQKKELTKSDLITGLLINALNQTDRFTIIERKDINELIREINFQESKWTESRVASALGNIHGVQYIVSGDLLDSSEGQRFGPRRHTFSLRMYDVNTGEIISTSAVSKTYLKDAIEIAALKLSEEIEGKAWESRVAGVSDDKVYIAAGFRDGIEEGDVFAVYRIGSEIIDPETKAVLGVKKENIGIVEVEKIINENLSTVRVLEKNKAISVGDIISAERIKKGKESEIELWRRIHDKVSIKDVDRLKEYSLSTGELTPQLIMKKYGESVVMVEAGFSLGSGFIVGPEGYIVTNSHVIRGASNINVRMANQRYSGARIIKNNKSYDIALLKIDSSDSVSCINLGDSDTVKIGERVLAIGNPEGFENTVSDGLVSGLREYNGIRLIQTSVPVGHGSSGGPLLNQQGEAIGVIVAGIDKKGNINFAVPINYIKSELLDY